MPAKILFSEPFFGGSHGDFAQGWAQHSAHAVELLTLPARRWKWHSTVSCWSFASEMCKREDDRPDVLVLSDYVDLARLKGFLPRSWRDLPTVVYFHENQLTYPLAPDTELLQAGRNLPRTAEIEAERNLAYGFQNIFTCLAADRVVFNSRYHRNDFSAAADELLARMPKPRPRQELHDVLEEAFVVHPGIDVDATVVGGGPPIAAPLRICFNHRWEHDKDPAAFLRAARSVHAKGIPIELVLLGQGFERSPADVPELVYELSDCIVHKGFVADRSEYVRLMSGCDLVVSTASHEFFGMAVLEALAVGCSALLPKRLSYPEVLPRDLHASGLYNPGEFGRRLHELAQEPQLLRETMHRMRMRKVAKGFSLQKSAAAMDAVIDGLL